MTTCCQSLWKWSPQIPICHPWCTLPWGLGEKIYPKIWLWTPHSPHSQSNLIKLDCIIYFYHIWPGRVPTSLPAPTSTWNSIWQSRWQPQRRNQITGDWHLKVMSKQSRTPFGRRLWFSWAEAIGRGAGNMVVIEGKWTDWTNVLMCPINWVSYQSQVCWHSQDGGVSAWNMTSFGRGQANKKVIKVSLSDYQMK